MSQIIRTQTLWFSFWPGWVIANGVGWFLFNVIYILPFWGLWVTVAIGFILSILQWGVLQKNDLADSMWIWVSVIPYCFFFFVIVLLQSNLSLFIFILVNIVCLGLLGLLQRSALAYYVNNATVWIIASPAASILGMTTSQAVGDFLFRQSYSAFYWAFSGIVYGCVTGAVIIFLYENTQKMQTYKN